MLKILLTTTGTLNPVVIDDFGARTFIHPTNSFDLLTEFTIEEVIQSEDLIAALNAGYITLKDEVGTSITNVANVANNLSRVTIADTTPATLNDKIQAGTNITLNVLNPGADEKLEINSTGGSSSGINSYSFAFLRDNSKPYVDTSSTSFKTVCTFPFLGTNAFTPTIIKIVGSRKDDESGIAEFRLFDLTNSNQISFISWTNKDETIYTMTNLSNLPANESIFEIQLRNNGGDEDDDKPRLHSFLLY